LGGFATLQGMRGTQKFSIHKAFGGETGLLPTAHTCYNQVKFIFFLLSCWCSNLSTYLLQLDLPMYSSEEELRDKLLMAIREGSEGFGFA
jgi:E3 ubiquitin-protein ligase HUWE1